jgi:nucleolar protein 56
MNKQEIIKITKKKVKQKLECADQKIINLSLIFEKLQLRINELTELLKIITDQEYPSLDQHVTIEEYCNFYLSDNKKDLEKLNLSKEKIDKINEIISEDIGVKLEDEIKQITTNFATNILELIKVKKNIENEIDTLIKNNYYNLYVIATPKIASKMIELAGSFEKLSRYPASTIQLLGAEKSFFKALKFNKKTPKYGIVYNHPLIINLSHKNKARFARTLSAKISLAIKADFEKKDISKELLEKINKKISDVK